MGETQQRLLAVFLRTLRHYVTIGVKHKPDCLHVEPPDPIFFWKIFVWKISAKKF